MNIKTKKTVAKEIIYFFLIVPLLLIVWIGIEIRNFYLQHKINNLSNEISIIDVRIDSIQKAFPKDAKTFNELLGDSTKKKLRSLVVDEYGIPMKKYDPLNLLSEKGLPGPPTEIWDLYDYLTTNKFDFANPNEK